MCADGKEFEVVRLQQNEASLVGAILLANMKGGDDGRCATVVDPPTEAHALPVTRVALDGDRFEDYGEGPPEGEAVVDRHGVGGRAVGDHTAVAR